ncbi:hypothetical protein WA026_016874 [Henosepilachna vigintioctopunctata]|uniref:Uncharacterized protein n=1 Tax=Henosepilachna vigintioctopunctata TaxID=420089 RepID=A0AAW1UAR6_9CUCU
MGLCVQDGLEILALAKNFIKLTFFFAYSSFRLLIFHSYRGVPSRRSAGDAGPLAAFLKVNFNISHL